MVAREKRLFHVALIQRRSNTAANVTLLEAKLREICHRRQMGHSNLGREWHLKVPLML